jgi:hypothetical protein
MPEAQAMTQIALPPEQTWEDKRLLKYPWRVSSYSRNKRPTVIDADGKVVCQLVNGTMKDAEELVRRCNAQEGRPATFNPSPPLDPSYRGTATDA